MTEVNQTGQKPASPKLQYIAKRQETLFETPATIIRREKHNGKKKICVYTGFKNGKPVQHKTSILVADPATKLGITFIWNGEDWQNVVVTEHDNSGYLMAVDKVKQLKSLNPKYARLLQNILNELGAIGLNGLNKYFGRQKPVVESKGDKSTEESWDENTKAKIPVYDVSGGTAPARVLGDFNNNGDTWLEISSGPHKGYTVVCKASKPKTERQKWLEEHRPSIAAKLYPSPEIGSNVEVDYMSFKQEHRHGTFTSWTVFMECLYLHN